MNAEQHAGTLHIVEKSIATVTRHGKASSDLSHPDYGFAPSSRKHKPTPSNIAGGAIM